MTNSVFQGRSFLAEKDFTRAELEYLIGLSAHLKDLKKRNIQHHYLAGKNIALLFEKTSTRTRAAFTTAAIDLGAHPEYLGANDIQLGKKESTEDTAKVLGRMFDGIEFRGFSQRMVEELAEGFAKESGAHVLITEDADEAVKDADVLYTDVWVSMGEEDKFAERVALLKPYQVNMDLVKKAGNENLIFLHCLPAFHDTHTVYGKDVAEKFGVEEMEVTDEVFRSKYARHFDQAENRMHTIKAVMAATLGNLYIPKV